MTMTRILEHAAVLYSIDCDFCGVIYPDNPLASKHEIEQLEVAHRARHCSNCYQLDEHEPWCEPADRLVDGPS